MLFSSYSPRKETTLDELIKGIDELIKGIDELIKGRFDELQTV